MDWNTEAHSDAPGTYLAPFKKTDNLMLQRGPNGGWEVQARPGEGFMPETVGYFGSAEAMIAALARALGGRIDMTLYCDKTGRHWPAASYGIDLLFPALCSKRTKCGGASHA